VPADVLRRTLVPAIMEQQSEKLMWRLRLRSYETVLEMALQGVRAASVPNRVMCLRPLT